MIINLFNNKNSEENGLKGKDKFYLKENNEGNEPDISRVKKYIIDNYIEHIKNENLEILSQKIDEYLYSYLNIIDEDKVNEIKKDVLDSMFGYGILQKFIDDEKVSDIRAVKFNLIYIKKHGKWLQTKESFQTSNEFYEYVRYCVLKNSGIINYDTPIVIISDKKFNLRIEAGIPPTSPMGPSLVIRIHRKNSDICMEKLLLEHEMFDVEAYKLLNNIIKKEKNIIVAGKGGSGKTTIVKAIIERIPSDYAITTNEETMEIFVDNKNIIQREVIENREESKKISLEKLSKHSLVMSNDVIIIGELKGSEASIFFDAISTGHIGIATVHSNSAKNTLDRLVMLVKRDIKNQQYKEEFIIRMLADCIDYVIFMKEYKIEEIIEVDYDDVNKVARYIDKYKRRDINEIY